MQSWLHVYVKQHLRGRKKTETYGTGRTTLLSRTHSIGYTVLYAWFIWTGDLKSRNYWSSECIIHMMRWMRTQRLTVTTVGGVTGFPVLILHISSNFASTETPLMGCTAALVPPDVGNCTVNIKLTVGNKLAVWMKSVHSKTECYCTYTFTSSFLFSFFTQNGRKEIL